MRPEFSHPPRISVLLPVRDGAATLGAALNSLLEQTFPDFEILLLDDGSRDASMAIAGKFSDRRLRVMIDGERRGLVARLNQGIDLAQGRYIARMDADDLAFPMRLEKQLAYLERHPEVDLLGCRAIVFRGEGEVVGMLPFAPDHVSLCARPWRNIPLPHPGWMGRAEWFRRYAYRSPEVRRAEDQELLLRGCMDSRYACLEEVLLAYRQGSFVLGKTLLARRTLLAAQLGLFLQRRQWLNATKAVISGAAKMLVDLMAALPGGERLFFRRMSGAAPASAIAMLRQLLDDSSAKK